MDINVCVRYLESLDLTVRVEAVPLLGHWIPNFRKQIITLAEGVFPSPHSELFLGTTLGIDQLKTVPTFNDMLRHTGTIHVVVVSGFNISLVYTFVFKLLGGRYKVLNIISGFVLTLLYALIAGFEPPIFRAWVMGSLAALSMYFGYASYALILLLLSSFVMVFLHPAYLVNLSFQLSFMATLGLILYGNSLSILLLPLKHFLPEFILEDLSASISAQITVWPLISYKIGTITLLSPLVNALILWVIPFITIVGIIGIIGSFLSPPVFYLMSYIVLPFLDYFVEMVVYFSKFNLGNFDYVLSAPLLVMYYIVIFSSTCVFKAYRERL